MKNRAGELIDDRRFAIWFAGMNSGLLATGYWLLATLFLLFLIPTIARAQDSDGDLMPDAYEIAHPCLQPFAPDGNVDYDADGMTSLAEYSYSPLLDPCVADTDGDEVSDGDEVAGGSNPLDPLITPKIIFTLYPIFYQRLTKNNSYSWDPSLAWTGSEFGVCWQDDRDGNSEIYFTRAVVDIGVVKIGNDVRITYAAGFSAGPSLVWSGSEFGVTWTDERDGNTEIYFCRLSPSGVKIGDDVRLTFNADADDTAFLVWTGSEFGVSWQEAPDGNYEIYFARVSASGVKIGADLRVTSAENYSSNPSLSWTGSEFGVSWQDSRDGDHEIYFARVSASGAKLGSDLRVTSAATVSRYPSLSWSGSEFGMSWDDMRDGDREIYFTRVSSSGLKIGDDVRLTQAPNDSYLSSLVWSGSEFAVSWQDYRDGQFEVYFTRVSSSGAKIGADLQISSKPRDSVLPSLAWTGSFFGVCWADYWDGNWEIYMNEVSLDQDGDGAITEKELAWGTNPLDWDTDDDGLGDALEVGYGCDPLYWDADGDGLPDKYEMDHESADPPLACWDFLDGGDTFDADTNPNAHEYWNGSDPWAADPVGGAGCFYWGDSGSGDGIVSPVDAIEIKKVLSGAVGNYTGVIPNNGETHELDMDGYISPLDLVILQKMIVQAAIPVLGSRPVALEILESPPPTVAVGMTCHVTVGVKNKAGLHTPGLGVIFEIVPGPGSATLLGGDGSAGAGMRYDISGPIASSGLSRIVLRLDSPGDITIRARIPACGAPGIGRSSPEIILDPDIIIHAQ